MESERRSIIYYEMANGRCPFLEWRDSLKDQTFLDALRVRIARVRLGLLGQRNSVGYGVYEFKFFLGPGYRVYYGEWNKAVIVLLCGGDKSSQARKDIQQAKIYWQDFRRSNS